MTRSQLLDAGLTDRMVQRRLTGGHLVQLHRGVYAVGHRHLRREAAWLAAVLAVPGSVLSHRDAAGLHGIRPANHLKVDVTTTGRATSRKGIEVHRTRVLDDQDTTTILGIRVTSLARTLVDLAGAIRPDSLAKALKEAERQQLLDMREVDEAMARTVGRRGQGHRRLTRALAERTALGATLTRSALEDAFQRLLRKHGLPMPRTNVVIEGLEVDAAWREARLVVELDGWEHHRTREAFQRDRERDAALLAAGWRVARFTHHDVTRRPEHVADTLRALLPR